MEERKRLVDTLSTGGTGTAAAAGIRATVVHKPPSAATEGSNTTTTTLLQFRRSLSLVCSFHVFYLVVLVIAVAAAGLGGGSAAVGFSLPYVLMAFVLSRLCILVLRSDFYLPRTSHPDNISSIKKILLSTLTFSSFFAVSLLLERMFLQCPSFLAFDPYSLYCFPPRISPAEHVTNGQLNCIPLDRFFFGPSLVYRSRESNA